MVMTPGDPHPESLEKQQSSTRQLLSESVFHDINNKEILAILNQHVRDPRIIEAEMLVFPDLAGFTRSAAEEAGLTAQDKSAREVDISSLLEVMDSRANRSTFSKESKNNSVDAANPFNRFFA